MNCHERKKISARFTFGLQCNKGDFMYYSRKLFWELATVVILRITYINKVKLGGWTMLSLHRKSYFSF